MINTYKNHQSEIPIILLFHDYFQNHPELQQLQPNSEKMQVYNSQFSTHKKMIMISSLLHISLDIICRFLFWNLFHPEKISSGDKNS